MTEPQFILASQSPRRAELLSRLGYRFDICPADIDELRQPSEAPLDYVRRLAVEKAQAISDGRLPVLGADTIVVLGDAVLEKPRDRSDGLRMLQMLSGQVHQVMTAVSVTDGLRADTDVSITEVKFLPLQAGQAEAYWATGEAEGKAGGYAIQGLAEVFVESLSGSHSGVVGLPLAMSARLLKLYSILPPALSLAP